MNARTPVILFVLGWLAVGSVAEAADAEIQRDGCVAGQDCAAPTAPTAKQAETATVVKADSSTEKKKAKLLELLTAPKKKKFEHQCRDS